MPADYGFINVLKPSGPTSADIVSVIKRITRCKRVGHMGTLDPLAAGVLVVALGKAAKFFDILTSFDKQYRAIFTFGTATDTADSDGKIIQCNMPLPKEQQVRMALESFRGDIMQQPHRYSAVKLGGQKAYELARAGQDFTIEAKPVRISRFELIDFDGANNFTFDIAVSSGTYIRSLCVDLAQKLGTSAYMSTLIRTGAAVFDIDNAITLQQLKQGQIGDFIRRPEEVLPLQKIDIAPEHYKKLDNGVAVSVDLPDSRHNFIYCQHVLFGVGDVQAGKVKVKIRLKD